MNMNKKLIKALSVLLVSVLVLSSMTMLTGNVLADEDEEEKTMVSLNPDVAIDEKTGVIHLVWQENITEENNSQYEVMYVNNMSKNFKGVLVSVIDAVETLIAEDEDYEDVLKELDKALEEYNKKDFKHSIDKVHHVVKDLEKIGNTELINILVDAVRDFAKTNILYAEYNLSFNNSYIQEAYEKYLKADEKYDAAIKMFKNSYLKIVEGYEENNTVFVGVDFGKIVRISYTDYDSVTPTLFLNGTIHVSWIEIINNETHIYYARTNNNGITWWYFDATEYATYFISIIGIDPGDWFDGLKGMLSERMLLEEIKNSLKDLLLNKLEHLKVGNDGFLHYPGDNIGGGSSGGSGGGGSPIEGTLPDLIVANISFSNNNPVEGETITIYATVKNVGGCSISGLADSIINRFSIGSTTSDVGLTSLVAGGTITLSTNWTALPGNQIITVTTDHGNVVTDEGDEGNNQLSKKIYVFYRFTDKYSGSYTGALYGSVPPIGSPISIVCISWTDSTGSQNQLPDAPTNVRIEDPVRYIAKGEYTVYWDKPFDEEQGMLNYNEGSGILKYRIQENANGGGWTTLSDNIDRNTFSYHVSGRSEGTYEYSVSGKTKAGWGGWSEVETIVVDMTKPTCSISYSNGWFDTNTISVSASYNDVGSNVDGAELQMISREWHNGYSGAWSTWKTVSNSLQNTYNINGENGKQYQFRYRVRDKAKLWSGYFESSNLFGVYKKPTASLSYPDGWKTDDTIIHLSFTHDGIGYPITDGNLMYKETTVTDGNLGSWPATWINYGSTGGVGSINFAGANGKAYKFKYQAKNSANGLSEWFDPGWIIKIDTTGPDTASISYDVSPDDGWQSNTWINITKTHSDIQSGISRVELEMCQATISNNIIQGDWSSWMTVDTDTASSIYSFNGSNGFAYQFRYRVRNRAGILTPDWYLGGIVKIRTGMVVNILYPEGWWTNKTLPISVYSYDPRYEITDGNLQYKCTNIINGDIQEGDWSTWTNYGVEWGDKDLTSISCDNGMAYKLRYQIKNINMDFSNWDIPDWIVKIDDTKPDATISYNDGWQSITSVTVTTTFSDNQSGINIGRLEYQEAYITNTNIGGWSGDWKIVDESLSNSYNFNVLNAHAYQFRYRVINKAGLLSDFIYGGTLNVRTGMIVGLSYPSGWRTNVNIPLTLYANDPQYGIAAKEVYVKSASISNGNVGTFGDWSCIDDVTSYTGSDGYAYQFKYRARNPNGEWSDFVIPEIIVMIDISPPAAPNLLLPWNDTGFLIPGQMELPLPFEWENIVDAVSGTDKYNLEISRFSHFSSPYLTTSPSNSTTILVGKGTYYWRVRAVDVAGNIGPWSQIWSFVITEKTIVIYGSNDFGETWEEMANGETHTFSSFGNGFTYKAIVPNATLGELFDFNIDIGYGDVTNYTDSDGDGINDWDEKYTYYTDPYNNDTDNDGMLDGEELNYWNSRDDTSWDDNPDGDREGSKALYNLIDPDSDNDWLLDGEEIKTYHTDPINPDCDNDGLNDNDEVKNYLTNPKNPDTDGDSMPDGWEVYYYLNPLDANDSYADNDDDNLTNAEEYNYSLNPTNNDTDNDSLSDYDEIYPTVISYSDLSITLQFSRGDFSHTIRITNVPNQTSWKDERIRLEFTVNPTMNCYVTIKGPINTKNYEYGSNSSSSFTSDGAALLGYATAGKTNAMRVTIIDGGTYDISLRRDDRCRFTASAMVSVPSSDEPPLFITVHYGNLDNVDLSGVGITSTGTGGRIEKQMYLARVLGFEWVRCDVSWSSVEPYKNNYNWEANHWNDFGNFARKYGLKLYMVVATHHRPGWAGWSGDTEQNHEKYFVREIVERINNKYADTVVAWQVHNEPGHPLQRSGIHTYEELMGFIREKAKEYQEIVLNPCFTQGMEWRHEDAEYLLGVEIDDEDAGIIGPLGWIGDSDRNWLLRADKVGFSNSLTVTGVDIYPDAHVVLNKLKHIGDAINRAEEVRGLKTGREKWVVEMPAGYCGKTASKVGDWIQSAINDGATAIGLYELVEGKKYAEYAAACDGYGIVNQDGKIYAGSNQNYYLMITGFTGVGYDIVNDLDDGARMIGWSTGTVVP